MFRVSFSTPARLLALVVGVLLTTSLAEAQVIVHPSLGLQTMEFINEPPAVQPISPGPQRDLPLGGGLIGGHPGGRLQLELMSATNNKLRLPISVEYFTLDGKTTFALSAASTMRKRRLTFVHDAGIVSANIGVTASFFKLPSLYVSGELKGVYFLPTTLTARIYYSDNDETIEEQEIEPFSGAFRLGAYLKVGSQVQFFEPLLLDFSIGAGGLNYLLKETDPLLQRNLMLSTINAMILRRR